MMMNQNLMSQAPPPSARDMQAVLDLIALLSDPAGAKARMEEFASLAEAARKAADDAHRAKAELAVERKRVDTEIHEARAIADAEISTKHSAFDAELSKRQAAIEDRERKTSEHLAAAEADVKRAAELRGEMERRMRVLEGK